MGVICGKKSKNESPTANISQNKPSEIDLTIARLKDMRDTLMSKKKQLNISIDNEDKKIKELIKAKKTDSAKFALQCKKLFEGYLRTAEEKDLVIKQMISSVDQAILDKSLNQVMKDTNSLLKDFQKMSEFDNMQNLMEEMKENQEKQKEVSDLFQKYNANQQEEVDNEYNLIEAQLQLDKFQTVELNHEVIRNDEFKHKNIDNKNKYNIEEKLAELA